MKVVIPDLVSNSYFPAIAAVEMGFFKEEGLDAELELIYPVGKCYEALRDGKADFVGGSSHSAPTAFPEWNGVKFLAALAQHTYWFLIMRSDLNVKRGDVDAVKGKRIGAAPLIDIGLIELLKEYGIDPKRDGVQIAPPPMPANPAGVSFGVNAARRWRRARSTASGPTAWAPRWRCSAGSARWCWMRGAATARASLRGYTFGVLATRADLVEKTPDKAAAAVRALVKTQKALKADPKRATKVGEKWFPAFEASLIANVGRARPAVLRPGDLQGHVRQHVQVRADGRPDQRRRQVRGRGGDAVQQFVEGIAGQPAAPTRSARSNASRTTQFATLEQRGVAVGGAEQLQPERQAFVVQQRQGQRRAAEQRCRDVHRRVAGRAEADRRGAAGAQASRTHRSGSRPWHRPRARRRAAPAVRCIASASSPPRSSAGRGRPR